MEEVIKVWPASIEPLAIRIGCVLLSSFFLCSANVHAQQVEGCPWLNRATAAGVLGGDVRLTVTHPEKDQIEQINGAPADATCEFKLLIGTPGTILRIAVHTLQDHKKDFGAYLALCGSSGHRLFGVGNEAIACVVQNDQGEVTQQVIARVRERAFLFTWSMPKPKPGSSEKDLQTIRDKVQNMTEQIAGSLF
ncbi:MAG: hypothetical protein ABSA39_18150 [Edaphobacter sp.]